MADLVTLVAPTLSRTENRWCIRPVPAAEMVSINYRYGDVIGFVDPKASDWKNGLGTNCAAYNVSNLLVPTSANEFSFGIGADPTGYIQNAATFYNDSPIYIGRSSLPGGDRAARHVAIAAQYGAKPLTSLVVIGHGEVTADVVGGMRFRGGQIQPGETDTFGIKNLRDASGYDELWSRPALAEAINWKFPAGCWFAPNATARFVGCRTNRMAITFAKELLRRPATAFGTDRFTWAPNRFTMGWGVGVFETGELVNIVPSTVDPPVHTINEYNASRHWVSHQGQN